MAFNDEYEQTLAQIKTCHVFKIPPRTSAEGYKAEGWLENHIWTGRCRVVTKGLHCEVRLEDPNTSKSFATCVVNTSKEAPPSIEAVTDSSRYFVLRVEDKQRGRHAFIGIGFEQRTDAFDFNVAIQDHQKFVEQQGKPQTEEAAADLPEVPSQNLKLKEGEKIHVNIKVKSSKGKVTATGIGAKTSGDAIGLGEGGLLLPPPPSAPGAKKTIGAVGAGAAPAKKGGDDLSDFLGGSSNTKASSNSNVLDFNF